MKNIYKALFSLYIFALLWLLLFKFSSDIIGVIAHHQMRSLNLIPFAGYSHSAREMLENLIVFIPFGMLLSVNAKKLSFWHKFSIIAGFSFAVEILQFIFAIGITDITDIITNAAGGLVGLAMYEVGNKYIASKTFDKYVSLIVAILVVVIILLRVFVLRVKY